MYRYTPTAPHLLFFPVIPQREEERKGERRAMEEVGGSGVEEKPPE